MSAETIPASFEIGLKLCAGHRQCRALYRLPSLCLGHGVVASCRCALHLRACPIRVTRKHNINWASSICGFIVSTYWHGYGIAAEPDRSFFSQWHRRSQKKKRERTTPPKLFAGAGRRAEQGIREDAGPSIVQYSVRGFGCERYYRRAALGICSPPRACSPRSPMFVLVILTPIATAWRSI